MNARSMMNVGSNPERQSRGEPGHCDRCAERGHVRAHPSLGCADVGCYGTHHDASDQPGMCSTDDRVIEDAIANGLHDEWNRVLGVSSVVRLRRDCSHHPAGTLAMVIHQDPAGGDRFTIMVPGDPVQWRQFGRDLEVVQGHELRWWDRKRSPYREEGVVSR